MSFDPASIRRALDQHGRLARIVVADIAGSTPREVGASMLVFLGAGEQDGTIGGGTLEHRATALARQLMEDGSPGHADMQRWPLGPAIGQCCGGSVTLVTEVFDHFSLDATEAGIASRSAFARPAKGSDSGKPLPLPVARAARQMTRAPMPARLVNGWLIEPVAPVRRQLWVWGAGHVGRALVSTLAPLGEFDIHWADFDPNRFPVDIPAGVQRVIAAEPEKLVCHCDPDALHLIVTHSHRLDLDLCHALLGHGFDYAGLIGSATKWARFRSRLGALGHGTGQIDRITCPIGKPGLGKHPQAIAIGVAATLLAPHSEHRAIRETAL